MFTPHSISDVGGGPSVVATPAAPVQRGTGPTGQETRPSLVDTSVRSANPGG
jgi:hypothetical protein